MTTTRKPTTDQEQRHRRIIATAVDRGRIPANRRGHWLNRLRRNPGPVAATLLTLTPITGEPTASGEMEHELAAWFG